MKHEDIEAAIKQYAAGYEALEDLQKSERNQHWLPKKGDQKTGLIGEYWAMRYARVFFKDAEFAFGGHSERAWDIQIKRPRNKLLRIQVKAASAYGKGKLSDIHHPNGQKESKSWDELWLIYLERDMMPGALWRLKPSDVDFKEEKPLTGKSIRRSSSAENTGSGCFKWENATVIENLLKEIKGESFIIHPS